MITTKLEYDNVYNETVWQMMIQLFEGNGHKAGVV